MKKEKKNEGLLDRREFFKKAAKATLPILGVIALSSTPAIAKQSEPMGCYSGCQFECDGTCKGGCMGCSGSCTGGCQGLCGGNCSAACRNMAY